MTDAPERIWAYLYTGARNKGQFHTSNIPGYEAAEYTRSDIAWNEALEAVGEKIRDLVKDLRDDAEVVKKSHPQIADERIETADDLMCMWAEIRAMKREPK